MTQGTLTAVVAVAAVALVGLLLRRGAGSVTPGASPPAPEPDEPDLDETEDDEPGEGAEGIVAVTSDGWSFVPIGDRDRVRLMPPRAAGGGSVMGGEGAVVGALAPEQLGRGDLIAARVKRGAPDHDPWRLEALGRDHEYRAWRFETEEAARAALDLVTRAIVQPPRDRDGEPMVIGDGEFTAARRREEEIEAELAAMPEADESSEDPSRRPIE